MSDKLRNLQSALDQSSGRVPANAPPSAKKVRLVVSEPSQVGEKAASTKAPSRVNQANISAWLHKDFKKSIRLVQAKKADNAALQDLMAEAFNELFAKYNVPTITEE